MVVQNAINKFLKMNLNRLLYQYMVIDIIMTMLFLLI